MYDISQKKQFNYWDLVDFLVGEKKKGRVAFSLNPSYCLKLPSWNAITSGERYTSTLLWNTQIIMKNISSMLFEMTSPSYSLKLSNTRSLFCIIIFLCHFLDNYYYSFNLLICLFYFYTFDMCFFTSVIIIFWKLIFPCSFCDWDW